jgi:hypothetical protein
METAQHQQTGRAQKSHSALDRKLRKLINWTLFTGAALYSAFHAGFVVWHTVRGTEQLTKVAFDHFPALVGLPFAGYGALALVLLLEARSEEPIEIKGFGFEFKGASGPVILWILCFVAIAACVKLTWQP